jgi:hypothetical protein
MKARQRNRGVAPFRRHVKQLGGGLPVSLVGIIQPKVQHQTERIHVNRYDVRVDRLVQIDGVFVVPPCQFVQHQQQRRKQGGDEGTVRRAAVDVKQSL